MKVEYQSGGLVDANCYVVKFATKAILIDPCIEPEDVKKLLGDYELAFIIVTHAHADHICTLGKIQKLYNVPIYLAKNAVEKIESAVRNYSIVMKRPVSYHFEEDVYHFVNDFERVEIEGSIVTFIHTKGHSNCSICVRIDDAFFSGDTIFKGSVGRCDLYTGNEADLQKSLKMLKKYFIDKCPQDMTIYPGHEYITSVEEELKNNPYLR